MVSSFFVFGAIEVKRKEKTVNVTCSFMPIDFRPGFTSFYPSTQAWSVALKKKCMNEKKCRCQQPCAGKSRTELRRLKCSLTLNLNPRTGLYLTMSMLSVGLVTSEHTESSLSERILA